MIFLHYLGRNKGQVLVVPWEILGQDFDFTEVAVKHSRLLLGI